MTTPGAWLTLLAAMVLVVGFLLSVRIRQQRMRVVGMIATLSLTLLTAWVAWWSSTVN